MKGWYTYEKEKFVTKNGGWDVGWSHVGGFLYLMFKNRVRRRVKNRISGVSGPGDGEQYIGGKACGVFRRHNGGHAAQV